MSQYYDIIRWWHHSVHSINYPMTCHTVHVYTNTYSALYTHLNMCMHARHTAITGTLTESSVWYEGGDVLGSNSMSLEMDWNKRFHKKVNHPYLSLSLLSHIYHNACCAFSVLRTCRDIKHFSGPIWVNIPTYRIKHTMGHTLSHNTQNITSSYICTYTLMM